MPPGQMSPESRQKATSAGGRARAAKLTPEERAHYARAGAAAVNSAPGLARRLLAKLQSPDTPKADKDEALRILRDAGRTA